MNFIGLNNRFELIDDVILLPLKVNRDPRGVLVETLKTTWSEVFSNTRPFTQNYFSTTESGVARDENLWHLHPTKQEDRFIVISGDIVVAIYDWRKESKTHGVLNLYKMGESNGDNGQFLLLIPKNVLHGFCVVSKKSATLLNYPTTLYDKSEEGRIPHEQVKINLPDGGLFSWKIIREEFGL